MYASMNFASRSELRKAVEQGLPVVLYSPIQEMPAINGTVRCEGPWPGTRPPVEDVPARGYIQTAEGWIRRTRQRMRVHGWHAYVTVKDMQIVEVH